MVPPIAHEMWQTNVFVIDGKMLNPICCCCMSGERLILPAVCFTLSWMLSKTIKCMTQYFQHFHIRYVYYVCIRGLVNDHIQLLSRFSQQSFLELKALINEHSGDSSSRQSTDACTVIEMMGLICCSKWNLWTSEDHVGLAVDHRLCFICAIYCIESAELTHKKGHMNCW